MISVSTVSVAGSDSCLSLRVPQRVTGVSEIHSAPHIFLQELLSYLKKANKCIFNGILKLKSLIVSSSLLKLPLCWKSDFYPILCPYAEA